MPTQYTIENSWEIDPIHPEMCRCHYRIVYNYRIMLVAVADIKRNVWSAYIGVVQGRNHEKEWPSVRSSGDSVTEEFAKIFFHGMPDNMKYGQGLT